MKKRTLLKLYVRDRKNNRKGLRSAKVKLSKAYKKGKML